MNISTVAPPLFGSPIAVVAILFAWATALSAQNPAGPPPGYNAAAVENGEAIFRRDCAFCHGRDAGGGESGPDLTRSRVVGEDVAGNTIAPVVRNGRPDRGMPAFHLSEQDLAGVIAFLHSQKAKAEANQGGRRGVDESDLQTGDPEAGKRYFAKACASCHSPAGDLAGIASRLKGLRLEERMLYPRGAKSHVTITLAAGQTVSGTLAYLDEFTVALRDTSGKYRSWAAADVKYTVSAPVEAHVQLLPQYSDDDVHDLMAYLQTLR